MARKLKESKVELTHTLKKLKTAVKAKQSFLANMGTPLMHLSCFHLLIGNAIIGYFEALLYEVVRP